MLLSELLRQSGLDSPGGDDPEVASVEYDSRRCHPGALFVAVPGFHVDGHDFAVAAVRAGAVAVVAERVPIPGIPETTPLLRVESARRALSALAATLAGHPSRRMTVAGITGTDGKTTTATMLWAAWQAAGQKAASVTTVDLRIGDNVQPSSGRITTLEATELHRFLAAAAAAGCTRAAVETSSHGLHLHRVDDVDYDLAVYTRITSEHLDIHGTREEYLRTKQRLLELVGTRPGGLAVLDRDDDFAYPRLAGMAVARRLTYSASGRPDADLVAEELRVDARGVHFMAGTPWGRAEVRLRMAGGFNAANALAALAAACGGGPGADGRDVPLAAAVRGVGALERVTGRMERVDLGQDFGVVVDYAHTTAALEKVLGELRPATSGRLWAVFGSAGERDREKRGAMGRVAARLADVVVVTDEDPRGEDRLAIVEEIAAAAEAAGAARGATLHVIPDRAEAVDFAISHASSGDTVLLAGKGHERTIETAAGPVPWDERAEAEAALRRRLGPLSGGGSGPARPP
ncbi:MAG: UDP-N-acetylmuramoyl-L-alanyl-D-glutamate--2,6-diaminopimelate ligase [Candidatus Dormibacteria bacterium]|jgi:UDP-N-acetylmuramoyl-L-alanyl-D-glutamate--2,6-diaminopimelate ligase